jgi:hypothetical protein
MMARLCTALIVSEYLVLSVTSGVSLQTGLVRTAVLSLSGSTNKDEAPNVLELNNLVSHKPGREEANAVWPLRRLAFPSDA